MDIISFSNKKKSFVERLQTVSKSDLIERRIQQYKESYFKFYTEGLIKKGANPELVKNSTIQQAIMARLGIEKKAKELAEKSVDTNTQNYTVEDLNTQVSLELNEMREMKDVLRSIQIDSNGTRVVMPSIITILPQKDPGYVEYGEANREIYDMRSDGGVEITNRNAETKIKTRGNKGMTYGESRQTDEKKVYNAEGKLVLRSIQLRTQLEKYPDAEAPDQMQWLDKYTIDDFSDKYSMTNYDIVEKRIDYYKHDCYVMEKTSAVDDKGKRFIKREVYSDKHGIKDGFGSKVTPKDLENGIYSNSSKRKYDSQLGLWASQNAEDYFKKGIDKGVLSEKIQESRENHENNLE